MVRRRRGAKRGVRGALVGFGALLLTALCCPVPSTGEVVDVAREKSQAVQASDQHLRATRQQLALADSRIAGLSDEEAARLTSFVVGNLLFVIVHELGHAVISQMNLPVLGREEDAADAFATLAMLSIGTELSLSVLEEAARGLRLTADRDRSADQLAAIYDEHSLDAQRAFQIVCLMIGSDPKKFRDIAAIGKIPADRVETCSDDYELAIESWHTLLHEQPSAASKPRLFVRQSPARKGAADVRVVYGGSETGPGFRSVLRAARLLEIAARFCREALSLPRPITIKAMKCGEPNAYWDDKDREVVLCDELVGEFIDLGLRSAKANQRGG